MKTMIRVAVWALVFLAVIAGVTYAASPWLIERLLPAIAERYGVRVTAIDVARPTLAQWSIASLELGVGEIDVRVAGVEIEYDIATLRARRVLAVSVDTLRIDDRSTTSGGIELPEEIDTLWALVPSDRLDLRRIEITSAAPAATLAGSLAFDQATLAALFGLESPLLPTPLDLDARIERSGSLSVRLGAVGRAQVLTLRAVPDVPAGRLRLDGVVSLQDAAFALAAKLAGAEPDTGHVAATVSGTLPWPLPDDSGHLTTALDLSGDVDLEFAGRVPGYGEPVDVAATAGIAVENGNVDVTIGDGAMIRTADIALLLGEAHGSYDLATATLSIVRASAAASGAALRLGDAVSLSRARVEIADATVVGEAAEARITIDTEAVAAGAKLPALVNGRLARAGDRASLTGALTLSKPGIEVGFDARASIAARQVDASIKSRVDVKRPLIASVLSTWKQPADVTAGALELDAQGSWSAAKPTDVSARGRVVLHEVAAHFDEFTAQRVNVDLAWQLNGRALGLETTRLEIGEVNVGVPVSAISAHVACCERKIVRDAKARLFGGTVAIPSFEYVPDGTSVAEATVDGVVLAEVVALQGDKVSATGTLDGRLPIRLSPEGVVVDGGKIAARAPGGHIAYRDAAAIAASAGQPGLDFALRALTDFTYDTLEGDIDYQADGTMTTKLRLRGRNPKVESGRMIHYNLNVTENVLDLLRSLRLADRVGQGIEKRLNN